MEKSLNSSSVNSNPYQKKITAYIDGSLAADEVSEFEAYVATHPEFEAQIRAKEEELALLKSLIPSHMPQPETLDSLESEMKLAVFNLLKEEPKNFRDSLKLKFEDWLSR